MTAGRTNRRKRNINYSVSTAGQIPEKIVQVVSEIHAKAILLEAARKTPNKTNKKGSEPRDSN